MSFTSLPFVLLFVLCLGLLYAVRGGANRTWLLIIFSYVFCASFELCGVIVVTLIALADFIFGRRIARAGNNRTQTKWLWFGLAVNLVPLGFLKYSAFLAGNLAILLQPLGIHIPMPDTAVLPTIGLSYFTFGGMSYLIDIYIGRLDPSYSFSEYLCYLVYFPKFIAGPIARAVDFLPQFSLGLQVRSEDVETGLGYILVGAAKKLVIADQLAGHVGMIMAAPQNFNAATLLQGLIGFTVQLYADFSGYSDMAIGCARLMGIKLPQNFLMPYSSLNIAEFWRRWHVTMSLWFRDYVFLPLEIRSRGIVNQNFRACRNIIVTMLLVGLWHGASWNFVLYGGVHGLALAVYTVYASTRRKQHHGAMRPMLHPTTLAARAITLSVVMLSNVLFATHTLPAAFTYLRRMLTWNHNGISLGSPYIVPLTAIVVIAHLVVNKDRNVIEELPNYSVPIRVLAYTTLLFALATLVPAQAVPFVYVRF